MVSILSEADLRKTSLFLSYDGLKQVQNAHFIHICKFSKWFFSLTNHPIFFVNGLIKANYTENILSEADLR